MRRCGTSCPDLPTQRIRFKKVLQECQNFVSDHRGNTCPQRRARIQQENHRQNHRYELYTKFDRKFKSLKRGGKILRGRGFKRRGPDNDRDFETKKFKTSLQTRGHFNKKSRGFKSQHQTRERSANETSSSSNKGDSLITNTQLVNTNLNSVLNVRDFRYKSEGKTKLNEIKDTILVEFLAYSGATEHLTHSKLIFKSFNENYRGSIRCANKNAQADLKTEGDGCVEIILKDNSVLSLNNLIFAESLTENLLSLRKFVDSGLAIYLDDQEIDVFDPNSNGTLLHGIYKRPYWIVELELNQNYQITNFSNSDKKRIFVNLTTGTNDNLQFPSYLTRSKTSKVVLEENKKNPQDEFSPTNSNENVNLNPHNDETKLQVSNTSNEIHPIEMMSTKNIYEHSIFDTTVWDRKFHDIDELPIIEVTSNESPFDIKYNEFIRNNKAMLWHVRMGHASLAYLKKLQKRFPDIESLRCAVFNDSILDCEICMLAKFNKLPFNSIRCRATQPLQIIHSDLMEK